MRNLVTLALALVLLGAATAASAGKVLQNYPGSDKCLQPDGGSLEEGAPIIQTTCNYSAIQRWEILQPYPDSTIFQLRNEASGLCLRVAGGAANHQPIIQWTCNWISDVQWDEPFPYDVLRSRVSGTSSHCLDVPGGTSEDVWVQLYSCNGTEAQSWDYGGVPRLPPPAFAGRVIQNLGSGKCLQPDGGSLEEGAPIIQTTCNDSPIQRWTQISIDDYQHIQLRNEGSGLCLRVAGGAANHQPIIQWTCNWISDVKWNGLAITPGPDTYYLEDYMPRLEDNHSLTSRVSGTSSHCLDVPGGTWEDVWVQLYSCNGTEAQMWIYPVRPLL